MTNICSNPVCSSPRDGAGRYCRACHAAYMRNWRRDHQQRGTESPVRFDATEQQDEELEHVARAVACLEAS